MAIRIRGHYEQAKPGRSGDIYIHDNRRPTADEVGSIPTKMNLLAGGRFGPSILCERADSSDENEQPGDQTRDLRANGRQRVFGQ